MGCFIWVASGFAPLRPRNDEGGAGIFEEQGFLRGGAGIFEGQGFLRGGAKASSPSLYVCHFRLAEDGFVPP